MEINYEAHPFLFILFGLAIGMLAGMVLGKFFVMKQMQRRAKDEGWFRIR